MKRVALFVHNLTVEYSLMIAQGAASYFTPDKDVKLILAQTNQPHYPHGLFEYQYWASAEMLKAEDVDLVMIVSSAYQTFIAPDELKKFLKSGGSRYPIESLKVAGVNMEETGPVQDACDEFKKIIADLKKLLHNE